MFVSSVTTTHFQLLYTIKRLSLVFTPFTPRKYKVNLIRTLTYRCLRICSKSTLLQSALSDLKNSLLQNGYPKGVINYNVNDLLHKHKNKPSQPTLTVPKKDVTLVLPYLGLHSDAITRRLKSCGNKFYGFVNLRVVFFRTLAFLRKIVSTGCRNLRLSTKPVAGIVMLFTSAKLKEDYMTERLSTSMFSLKLLTPPLLLSIRFPLVTKSNGTILRS